MANNTLHIMYLDMADAATKTQSLNGFYMIDESEINSVDPLSFPIAVVEIPSSSVSNINKAWEEYEMSVFILEKHISSYTTATELQRYDSAMTIFTEWISELMGQRDGDYVVDKESFEIERIRKFSSHSLIGVKVNFVLLASSKLQYYTENAPETTWNITSGLMQLYNGSKNVTIGSTTLLWSSELGTVSNKYITQHESGALPAYSSPTFTFSPPVSNPAEAFKIDNYTFSTSNFSFFFKMSVVDWVQGDTMTLLRITDSSSGDGFILGLTTGSSDSSIDGRPFVRIDDDNDSGNVDDVAAQTQINFIGADLEPLANTVVGLVNDSTNDKINLYVGVGTSITSYQIDASHSNQFSGAQILIGGDDLDEWNFSYRGFIGTISHIAIYDSAVSLTDAQTISTDLNNL